ncbi:hypothetical protein EVAR_51945_1 [Eumeta japonica]|uniref:Uncharacterized protein n=1 Tax=Eumeta variegata TaxID=151549 RepID=A0A4C1YGR6_EUMVA|nr:hypothetical protein EVAR_51945_1 [Eumeta japonica]
MNLVDGSVTKARESRSHGRKTDAEPDKVRHKIYFPIVKLLHRRPQIFPDFSGIRTTAGPAAELALHFLFIRAH